MNSNAVWNALTVGEQTASLPESLKAMKAREIGFAHLATLANTADKLKGFDESVLLPVAKEHSPGKFFHKAGTTGMLSTRRPTTASKRSWRRSDTCTSAPRRTAVSS